MPSRLNAPVLTLDAAKMHQIDPRNVESLFGMWMVFNKCSQSIKDGSRLENMSWRVWARETLCCPPQPEKTIVPAIDIPCSTSHEEVPSLSNSPSSDTSSDNEGSQRKYGLMCREDSALSKSRGKETHLTPSTLERIVTTIQEKGDLTPLSPSLEASLPPVRSSLDDIPGQPLLQAVDEEHDHNRQLQNSTDSCLSNSTAITPSTTRQSEHRNSDTSVSSDGLIRTGSVVHGFSPVCNSFKARGSCGSPFTTSSKLIPKPAKKPGMFQLGASSEDDDGSSFEQKVLSIKTAHKRSSLSQSLAQKNISQQLEPKKVTSYRDIVEQRRIHESAENDEGAIESSDEDDEESAIDDDDEDEDGDWEDSNSDDERAPVQPNEHLFRRVESRPNLVSRPSMLSMQLHEKKRGGSNLASTSTPAFRRSRPSSPQGLTMQGSPDENNEGMMMHNAHSQPRPIVMPNSSDSTGMAHSPRTTRRNMLSTELPESLRKSLLWERQQKSQTVNAFLIRSRNAQSMANLPAMGQAVAVAAATAPQPMAPPPATRDTSKNNSWNHYFDSPWEYHTKGW